MVIGVGGSKGARISHIVSRDIKAEFCVGEVGGGHGGGEGIANITNSEHTCQNYQNIRSKLYLKSGSEKTVLVP